MTENFLVIFDLDGVIVDTIPYMKIAFEKACDELYKGKYKEKFSEYISHQGRPIQEIIGRINFVPEFCEIYYKHFDQIDSGIKLCEGIPELINELKNRNCRLAVATGKNTLRCKSLLSSLDILNFFDLVVGSDLVNAGKPAPDMINLILNHFHTPSEKAILIGDSPIDIESSKAANVKAYGASWAGGCEKKLMKAGAVGVLKTPAELMAVTDD